MTLSAMLYLSVAKDLYTIDLARCVVDVSRVQLIVGLRAVALYDVLLGHFPMDRTTLRY